jgi:hydrocephalus-inducing protein
MTTCSRCLYSQLPAADRTLKTSLLCAGIDASNIGSIFEEHVVLSNLDPFKPINCSFGLRDKVFNFGTVIAQVDASDAVPASVDASSASGGKGDKKPAKAAYKGAARASVSGPGSAAGTAVNVALVSLLDDPGAVKANLKFINPIKVPCTVNFSIKPRGGTQPGTICLRCCTLYHGLCSC